MISILSAKKTFTDPWIGSRYLNDHGLHRWRMRLAEACAGVRRRFSPPYPASMNHAVGQLERQGFAVVPDFLATGAFTALAAEVEQAFAALAQERPVAENTTPGFGAPQPFPGGFDRYDGGTLNRFIHIDPAKHPAAARLARDRRLDPLTSAVCGKPHAAHKTQLYLTVNGREEQNADIQKVLHRDTYFSSMKFWYFLRPVTAEDGPFTYVPGSHRLTEQRLAWEQEIASAIVHQHGKQENEGGSFRIGEHELAGLGLGQPVAVTCAENTLVIANTLGFHRRGDARPGRSRLAIYGWRRPYPFGLLGF